jgi:histidyl-tRNA synthetase
MGLERILLALPAEPTVPALDVAVVVADPSLRVRGAVVLRDLRRAGLSADGDLRGGSMKSQLRRAERLGARTVAIVGPAEEARGCVQLKDMRVREQSDVRHEDLVAAVRARLAIEASR